AYHTMDAEAARSLRSGYHCARNTMSKMFESTSSYAFDREALTLRCLMTTGMTSMGPGALRFAFADTPRPQILRTSKSVWLVANAEGGGRMSIFGMDLDQGARAERLAAAWRALANPPAEEPTDMTGVAPLSEIPEEARRFKIEAELAVKEKRFFDAAIAYRKGLALAPGWVAGRFNSALLLGECGLFYEAAAEMKRYLSLKPDAPNARAAQDQIYAWEAKSKR
ncbi:MAG TPA: hypothetical protein VNI01_07830, partial [Elusimicrobiota bacterium]|nr:hypothetical protein [Elusimicrobiota bacterium]